MIRTTLVEVHGNDGSSLARARSFVTTSVIGLGKPGRVIDATFSGTRCQHGALVVTVEYDDGTGSRTVEVCDAVWRPFRVCVTADEVTRAEVDADRLGYGTSSIRVVHTAVEEVRRTS